MKFAVFGALACAVSLSACAPAPSSESASAPEAMAVSSVAPFVGKTLIAESGTVFLFNADGTMGGELGGEPVSGAYSATATEVCSTYTWPAALVGREFCSTPDVNGDQVIFNRRDGSVSDTYTIQG